jgi:hypothetical protein
LPVVDRDKLGTPVAFIEQPKDPAMLSIERRHPEYAESCHCLRPGQSAYSLAEVPFDLHRYHDGWHIFWKNPPNGKIGRFLRTRTQLNAFLEGNWRVGTVLRSPIESKVSKKRFSSRGK